MKFERSETGTTPTILMDTDTNTFFIEGRSLAEDAATFYGEVVDWMDENLTGKGIRADLVVKLDYCNTSSFLGMSHVFRKLLELNSGGCSFRVKWRYQSDDEDWLEDGENFQEVTDVPFVFEAFESPEQTSE